VKSRRYIDADLIAIFHRVTCTAIRIFDIFMMKTIAATTCKSEKTAGKGFHALAGGLKKDTALLGYK